MEYNSARGVNTALRDRVQRAGREADTLMTDVLSKNPGFDQLVETVKEYTRVRYLLEPEDMVHAAMRHLGELSLARGLNMPIEKIRSSELDSKCKNTSSEMPKKILLVIALNKVMGINIDETQTAEITSLNEIACEAARQYLARSSDATAR